MRLVLCDMRDRLLGPPHMQALRGRPYSIAYYPDLTEFAPVQGCPPFMLEGDRSPDRVQRLLEPQPNGEYTMLSRQRRDGTTDYLFLKRGGSHLIASAGTAFTRISHTIVAPPSAAQEQSTGVPASNIRDAYQNFTRIVRKGKPKKEEGQ